MAKAVGIDGIRAAINGGVDSIAHACFTDQVILNRLAQSHVSLVPTLSFAENFVTYADQYGVPADVVEKAAVCIAAGRQTVKAAVAAGVDIGVGTDPHHHEWITGEIGALVRAGVPLTLAIQGATSLAAQILGLATGVGRLQADGVADLSVVGGDPHLTLKAMDEVLMVVNQGRVLHKPNQSPSE